MAEQDHQPTNRLAAPEADVAAYQAAGRSAAPAVEISDSAEQASTPFVGQWRRLVSTTNWEKGQIICRWRSELEASGASAGEFSDEAWAQLVGGVTGQHVGRLRRVFQRFGDAYPEYDGLYWSHFQAACEWDDAEMWLEGAVQNRWSVSQMRGKRWEVVGPTGGEEGDPSAAATAAGQETTSIDEEGWVEESLVADPEPSAPSSSESGAAAGGDEGDEDPPSPQTASRELEAPEAEPPVRPFAELPELPEDVADAFEQMKLAILRHKLAGWAEISRADLLGVLASLKQLAEAPADA